MKGLLDRATVFNTTAPGANTDILSTAISVVEGSALRVTVALTTGSVFNVTCTDGTTTHTWGLNSSAALTAGDVFTFTIGANPTESNSGSTNTLSYNFQVETDGVIEYLSVQEAQLGTP